MVELDEVDPLIGHRYGNKGQLLVTGWNGKRCKARLSSRLYQVRCDICSANSGLEEGAVYDCTESAIRTRAHPCDCVGTKPRSLDAWEVLIREACKSKGFIYGGYVGEWMGNLTKLRLTCTLDGRSWESTTAGRLLLRGDGCPTCKARGFSQKLRLDDVTRIEQFSASGNFLPGTIFGMVDDTTWAYTCPSCSNDEYVKAGVCSGVFTAPAHYLVKGTSACRCSQMYRWTQPLRDYQIQRKLATLSGITFVRWVDGYKNCDSRIVLKCEKHTEWECGVSSFLHRDKGCPSCAVNGFNRAKAAFVYVILVAAGLHQFTGYGITGNVDRRLHEHTIKLAESGYKIESQQVFGMPGEDAYQLEKKLKTTFETHPQDIDGFRTEATYGHMYETVVKFIEKEKPE